MLLQLIDYRKNRSASERVYARLAWIAILAGLCMALSSCELTSPGILEQIKERGKIRFITRNSPTTYYEGANGPTGFEYELMKRFARRLGVQLEIIIPDNFSEIIPKVALGEVDIAAAGLTVTESRKKRIRFGPGYQNITQEVVYRSGSGIPYGIESLVGKKIELVKGSSHVSRIRELKKIYPGLVWDSIDSVESGELIAKVWRGEIDITIADSNEVAINQAVYPEIRSAFSITDPQSLAWGIPPRPDKSLDKAVADFFDNLKEDGTLVQLLERYYSHTENFNYTENRILRTHVKKRLVYYLPYFKQAAEKYNKDWRFFAAMGYQESHWRRRAISPTGVRGIMMLTLPTASQVGVTNRLNARQSIMGGAEYFMHIEARIPQSITEPDRAWMTLAAYNMGYGHLQDVRKITRERGMDADKWVDVKENLPLLMRKKWYKKTRYGYARGTEAKRYVENIRRYFEQLKHLFPEKGEPPPEPLKEPLQGDTLQVHVPAL